MRALRIPQAFLGQPELEVLVQQLAADPPVVAVRGAYAATAIDAVILADASAGAFTITLPRAAAVRGQQLAIKKIDASANAVTVAAFYTDTIDGASTRALTAQWRGVTVVSDGQRWLILSTI